MSHFDTPLLLWLSGLFALAIAFGVLLGAEIADLEQMRNE